MKLGNFPVRFKTKPYQISPIPVYEDTESVFAECKPKELVFLKCPSCGYMYSAILISQMRFKPESCERCGQWFLWSE